MSVDLDHPQFYVFFAILTGNSPLILHSVHLFPKTMVKSSDLD